MPGLLCSHDAVMVPFWELVRVVAGSACLTMQSRGQGAGQGVVRVLLGALVEVLLGARCAAVLVL